LLSFFFQAEDGIRDFHVTGVQTCALPIYSLLAVVVTATARRESVSSVLSMQKNNSVISDGISVESIKRSPDSNVGEVLKRVSGRSEERRVGKEGRSRRERAR